MNTRHTEVYEEFIDGASNVIVSTAEPRPYTVGWEILARSLEDHCGHAAVLRAGP